ncbi:MAG: fibronectin type III domain-containing protein, partial [Candidatus Omnitrophica bacterium]|nr:fibronectin type III domain-containing protein [Candidatus Omnitrophota bacterium]
GFTQIATPGANTVVYEDNNLASGMTYYYRIKAFNEAGDSAYSDVLQAHTLSALVVSATQVSEVLQQGTNPIQYTYGNGFTITNNGPLTGFRVTANNDATFTPPGGAAQPATPTDFGFQWSVGGINAGDVYTVRTFVLNSKPAGIYTGTGKVFESISGKPEIEVASVRYILDVRKQLAAPSNLSGTAISYGEIDLSWTDNSSDEEGFEIFMATSSNGPFERVEAVAANTTTYRHLTAFNPGQTYYYNLKAYRGAVNSDPSNTAAVVMNPPVPTAPGNLTAMVISGSEVKFTWSDNSNNEDGFKIGESINSNGPFYDVETAAPNSTTITRVFNYTPGTTYYFSIRAFKGVNFSGYSNIIPVTVLAAPSDLSAQAVSSTEIDLTWRANANTLTGFKLERSTSPSSGFAEIAVTGVNITTYNNSGLTAGTTYYYRVRAFNTGGYSDYSNIVSITTPVLLAAPSNLTSYSLGKRVVLSWVDNSTDETGFKIERRQLGADFSLIATVAASIKTYTDSDPAITEGTNYDYRVYAYRGSNKSAYSNTSTVPVIVRPADLTAGAISGNQVNLAWRDNSNNEAGFRIIRGSDLSLPFTVIATLGANTTSYSDTGLTPNTKYYYLVYAFIGNSYSEYTNYGIVTTTPTVPAAPKNLTVVPIPATGTTDQVKLDWQSDSTDVDEFLIELSYESAAANFIQIGTAVGTARTISWYGRFPDNTTSYYRVRARNSVGYSGYSNVVSIVTHNEPVLPLAPTNLTATVINANNIRLSWKNNTITPATEILIERHLEGASFAQLKSITAAGDTQTDDDLNVVPGKKYYYRVRAHNANGDSGYSAVVNATTPSSIQTPTNLRAEVWDYHSVRLIWNDSNNDETGFEVWRSTTSGSGFTFVQNVPTHNSTVMVTDDTTLNPLTTYYYIVRAYNKNGIHSAFSNQAFAKTPDTPFPHAPTNLVATSNASNKVNLTWKDNSNNELGFNIYRSKGTSGNFYLVTVGALVPKNVTKFTDTSVSGGTLYYYRVMAVNASGESGYAEASVTTP